MIGKKRTSRVLVIALATIIMMTVPVSAIAESSARGSVKPEMIGVTLYNPYLSKSKFGVPVDPDSFEVGDMVYIVANVNLTRSGTLTHVYLSIGPALGFVKLNTTLEAGAYGLSEGFEARRAGSGVIMIFVWLSPIGYDYVSLQYSVS